MVHTFVTSSVLFELFIIFPTSSSLRWQIQGQIKCDFLSRGITGNCGNINKLDLLLSL